MGDDRGGDVWMVKKTAPFGAAGGSKRRAVTDQPEGRRKRCSTDNSIDHADFFLLLSGIGFR